MNVLSLFDGMSCGQIALNRAGIKYDKYYASEIDKFAISVTMKNYPETIQLGSVTEIKAESMPQIDFLIGGSPCFVSGTKIICKNKIKNIEDVQIGDYVLTHKNIYQKVLSIGNQISNIYKLQAQGSTSTLTTEEHPYYIRKRNRIWDNKKRSYFYRFETPEWVKVKDIKKGDYVGTPILKNSTNPYNLTEKECLLLGLYIGDGHTRKDYRNTENRPKDRNWQLIISVGSHEKDLFQRLDLPEHSFFSHTKSVHRAVFSNKRLVQIAEEHCGIGAENKYLSKMLLDLPINLLSNILDGYEFSDGSFRRNVYRATTISKSLVETLALAIAKVYKTTCCIEYTIRKSKTIIEGREVNQKNTYTISYRKDHCKQSRAWVIDGVVWNPIKNIVITEDKEKVYNLEIDKDNSYIANNHIVHNCQGFSFAGKQLNFDDPRSKLFFEYVRLLRECKPKYFLLENVKMKKEYKDIISSELGCQPIEINSALVSAQNRKRLYWTNIPNVTQPEDKGILLKDVIEKADYVIDDLYKNREPRIYIEKSPKLRSSHDHFKCAAVRGRYLVDGVIEDNIKLNKATILGRRLNERGVREDYNKDVRITQCLEVRASNTDKSNCLTTVEKDNVLTTLPIGRHIDVFKNNLPFRYYTIKEYCRLQTVPDDYFPATVSENQSKKMLGNGWTIDVIAHIFKGLK